MWVALGNHSAIWVATGNHSAIWSTLGKTVPGSATQCSVNCFKGAYGGRISKYWVVWCDQLEESLIDWKVRLLRSHFKCMEMRRLVSRISNSSSFVSWLLESMMLGHTSMVVSIWPHPSVTRPSEVRRDCTDIRAEPHSESGFVCL